MAKVHLLTGAALNAIIAQRTEAQLTAIGVLLAKIDEHEVNNAALRGQLARRDRTIGRLIRAKRAEALHHAAQRRRLERRISTGRPSMARALRAGAVTAITTLLIVEIWRWIG